ncbi:MAG: Gfo/Idh/MocA family oxidoreductase [Halanaerobium sp.]|nr:Gfo/Idh/MocA family oxidoreductase [Halanaerobium sp.]
MKKGIKVGLVGFGSIGRVHTMANLVMPVVLKDLPFKLTLGKVYRKHQEGSLALGEGYATSLEEILQDEATNVVDICTPNHLHREQALGAIEYRKDLYLEKPLGNKYHEAGLLTEEAEEAGVANQTAFVYRFLPAVVSLRDLVREKSIGEIIDFQVVCWHSSYLNRERPISWKLKEETSGGGPLLDLGIHLIDMVRFVLGEVAEVSSEMKTVIKQRPEKGQEELQEVDVEDWARTRLSLENGIEGIMEVSRVASVLEQKTEFIILGTKGSIKFSTDNPALLTSIPRNGE